MAAPATPGTQTPPADFDIAIIGAGIGGLALAIGLTHLNVPYTVYESAPAFSMVGAGVGLGPNALKAMDLIDARFRNMYLEIATGNLDPEKKHVMMEAMLMKKGLGEGEPWWGHGGWGADNFERTGAHRKDLLDIMTSFIPEGAVVFNKRVQTLKQTGSHVTLQFEDGDVRTHCAAIGTDGIKGFTRRLVLEDRYPEHVAPKYTGKYIYRTILPMDDAKAILGDLATDAKMFMGVGGNLSTYPISEGRSCNVVAFKRDPKPWAYPDFTYDVTKEDMLGDFDDMDADPRLVKLLDNAKPTRWGVFHHPITPIYYNSLICMLGDVAHAGGPHQAAGAGQCLEDALILSKALGTLYHLPSFKLVTPETRQAGLEAAFQAYDEVRRPRAQKQVITSSETGDLYTFVHPECGDNIVKTVANLNQRFSWLWDHDLAGDVKIAEDRVKELVARTGTDSPMVASVSGSRL